MQIWGRNKRCHFFVVSLSTVCHTCCHIRSLWRSLDQGNVAIEYDNADHEHMGHNLPLATVGTAPNVTLAWRSTPPGHDAIARCVYCCIYCEHRLTDISIHLDSSCWCKSMTTRLQEWTANVISHVLPCNCVL